MKRRVLLAAAGALAGWRVPSQAQSAHYPSKPVRWVMPFPAGGPTDAIARKLAEACSARLGQPIVVENKPGAAGSIGTAEVVRSAPDGYNLAIAIPDSLIGVASLVKSPGYDARTDITPIMKVCHAVPTMIVSQATGVHDVAQLLAAARSRPGTIAYGSWGQGTLPHLVMKTIEGLTGTSFLHVPYKGLAPVLTDLAGNQVQIALVPSTIALQYQQKGLSTTVATLGGSTPALPNVQTIQQQGLDAPMLRATLWTALVGPKNLPPALVEKWARLIDEVTATPEFEQFLASLGQTRLAQPSDVFARDLSAEWIATTQLSRQLGITPS